MANEKFLTYAKTDPNSRFTVTDARVTYIALDRNETAHLTYNKGANFFDGDFVHLLTAYITASVSGSFVYGWALADSADSLFNIDAANGDFLGLNIIGTGASARSISISECDGGTIHTDSYLSAALATPYYLKIVRDEAVGTYGTLYCYIYSDAARATTPLDTLILTLHTSKKDFQYVYGVSSWDSSATPFAGSGYFEDLQLVSGAAAVLPEVTQQTPTSIDATTATGNGDVGSVGLSPATAHGHCWKTEAAYLADGLLPLTSDSNVDNGAVAALGAFTSAVTGLTAGTRYIMRVYATNTQGTAYSNIAYVWYSGDSSILEAGNFAVKQKGWHYVGADGVEYYLQGIPVT